MELVLQIGLLIIGFTMLVKGADYFVDGAADISIGNVVGSNILNILIILGITGFITSVAVQKSTLIIEMPFMLAITVLLITLGMTGNELIFVEGIIFWICFIIYLGYLYVLAKKGVEEEETEDRPVWKLFLFVLVGGIVVVWGANISVNSATAIAQAIGISERFIGLTIVALGTSLPELVASVTAARKGNADIAIGNIVGSNIFNILFVLGTSALITPVPYQATFLVDGIIAVAAGVLLWGATIRKKELTRPWAIVMLLGYVAYFVYLLV